MVNTIRLLTSFVKALGFSILFFIIMFICLFLLYCVLYILISYPLHSFILIAGSLLTMMTALIYQVSSWNNKKEDKRK